MVSLLVSAGSELGEPKDLIITVYQAAHTVNGKSGPDGVATKKKRKSVTAEIATRTRRKPFSLYLPQHWA